MVAIISFSSVFHVIGTDSKHIGEKSFIFFIFLIFRLVDLASAIFYSIERFVAGWVDNLSMVTILLVQMAQHWNLLQELR